jgi:hypothetical protein
MIAVALIQNLRRKWMAQDVSTAYCYIIESNCDMDEHPACDKAGFVWRVGCERWPQPEKAACGAKQDTLGWMFKKKLASAKSVAKQKRAFAGELQKTNSILIQPFTSSAAVRPAIRPRTVALSKPLPER